VLVVNSAVFYVPYSCVFTFAHRSAVLRLVMKQYVLTSVEFNVLRWTAMSISLSTSVYLDLSIYLCDNCLRDCLLLHVVHPCRFEIRLRSANSGQKAHAARSAQLTPQDMNDVMMSHAWRPLCLTSTAVTACLVACRARSARHTASVFVQCCLTYIHVCMCVWFGLYDSNEEGIRLSQFAMTTHVWAKSKGMKGW